MGGGMDGIRTSKQAADELGVSASRVRRMAVDYGYGVLLNERTRVFTESDMAAMRARVTGRVGWPKGRPRTPKNVSPETP